MKCIYCNADNPDQVQLCVNCGEKMKNATHTHWHSLHSLLWGNKINQDILETLNELRHQNENFIDSTRKLKKAEEE